MKKHLEKLKKKSESERKKLATIFAVIVTVIIVVIWLILISFSRTDNSNIKKKNDFNLLKKELSEIGDNFQDINTKFDFKKNINEDKMVNDDKDIEKLE